MLSPSMKIARSIRDIRVRRNLTQRQLAALVGCSQPYLAQIERGQRPVSQKFAGLLEEALKQKAGAFSGAPPRSGRRPLGPGLDLLRLLRHRLEVEVDEVPPEEPRVRRQWGMENTLASLGKEAGPEAAKEVARLERRHRGDESYWRFLNSIRFDTWQEKHFIVQLALRSAALVGLAPGQVGCAVACVDGVSGKSVQKVAHPAFLLTHGEVPMAWFPQVCVRTESGHDFPDNLVVVASEDRWATCIVEINPKPGSSLRKTKHRELRIPVIYVPSEQVGDPEVLDAVLDWLVTQPKKASKG